MLKRLGWLAVGGFAVGFVGLGMAAHLGAGDLPGFVPWPHHWAFAISCRDDGDIKTDARSTERRWAWDGGDTAQAYLAGYLIEKSLSLDNVFVFTVIFAMFAIPLRYQHRVLMAGIIGALGLRAAFIAGGAGLLHSFHAVVYVFGALLLWTAIRMLRSDGHLQPGRSPRR